MKRLGVIGTMVWDTIHQRDPGRSEPVEEWGGICYALSAFEATAPDGWELLPIIKVGGTSESGRTTICGAWAGSLRWGVFEPFPSGTTGWSSSIGIGAGGARS